VKYFGANCNGCEVKIRRESFMQGALKDCINLWIETNVTLTEEVYFVIMFHFDLM
jgi:hypothetical protein